ncbi:MAG: hypothetical protein ONB13_13040 [candidate division KSB1 bacterium]|nr:hypothetical protein [candidate division KSB1 bacterium]MDZ7377530.1 hypothetical protein [candidate division KSB1 bacterium]
MGKKTAVSILALIITITACRNPFFDDKISGGRTTITGQMQLSGESSFENIFVYLNGLDIGTWTDAKGEFTLRLPPHFTAGTSLNGIYDLYGYVANFTVKANPIAIRDGQFVYGDKSLDSKGRLSPTPLIRKILEVTTHLSRGYKGDSSIMSVVVHLYSIGERISVVLPNATYEFLGGVIIHNLTTGEVITRAMPTAGFGQLLEVTIDAVGRDFYFLFSLEGLPMGEYEVIPHVLPNYNNLARKIANCMGIDPTRLSEDFLKWPVRYQAGRFTLTE